MKTIEFNIVKKNRKFFAATKAGYPCKIEIDANSKALEMGVQSLIVDDVSVRTKYGTDLIYKLHGAVEEQKAAGICTLKHRYNKTLVEACRNLGGRFDKEACLWVFSDLVADKVDELDALYNDEMVSVEIEAMDYVRGHQEALYFMGYTLAVAWGRDSGAKVADDVALVDGQVNSGGSMRNWTTVAYPGAKFRLKISKNLLDTYDGEKWTIKVMEG